MGLVALARKQQYKMKFLVLAAFLGCVAAEADPALFYGNGLTYGAGVYGGLYGGALGYAGYAGYPAYTVAAPVARTVVSAPVTTTYTRSYTFPSVYSGYGLTGYHGLGYAGLYGYGLPLVAAKTEVAEAETGVEEARKKREAEADPAYYYSSFASPTHGYSYGLNTGYAEYHGLGYAGLHGLGYGYHGLGYAGYHGLGYAGLHGLGYAGYPYGYVVKPVEKAAEEAAVEEA